MVLGCSDLIKGGAWPEKSENHWFKRLESLAKDHQPVDYSCEMLQVQNSQSSHCYGHYVSGSCSSQCAVEAAISIMFRGKIMKSKRAIVFEWSFVFYYPILP